MVTVCCFLWSDPERKRSYTYGPEHVRILKSMVERNLTLPHRFVCITDETIEGIETVPLDWSKHVPGTCAVKLMAWRPDMGEVLGKRILLFDLDIVITGGLDDIAGRTEDVVLFRNPNFPKPRRAFYQGSIQLFTAGARPQVWDDFDPQETPKWVNWRFGGMEQAWLSECLSWDEAYFDHRDGIYGAGRLNGELPKNARIVVFPGERAPHQAEVQERLQWVKEHYY